ncbi:hypothetical protein N7455_008879 [Penicillium solitum]|uniref:uncharacterized protein n=1 Tax=Penicillium solitum TaxID=60172 RepID=UPI0032C445B5|nr:hypothetical protein N7455_008879 [Penicillium solitum]
MENLNEAMGNVSLGGPSEDPDQLLFKPQAGSGLAPTALDKIPRYLFRVASTLSSGTTNGMWVHSESAYQNQNFFTEDIFFDLDDEKRKSIAQTLNLHLRWSRGKKTSSLPFAIQYIYYRHLSPEDGSSLEDIKLYVIDTTQFPKGTFLPDLDLINAFWKYDHHSPREKDLEDFRSLRNQTRYYFGEYLSQGSLKIQGKREIISATSLFEGDRLRHLQPHFRVFEDFPFKNRNPIWANEVIRLRDVIWQATDIRTLSPEEMEGRLEAVKEIVQDLEPSWRFPLAIYFTSLIGSGSLIGEGGTAIHNVFSSYFRSTFPAGQQPLNPSSFRTVVSEKMPEIKQVERLVREIHKYHALEQALERITAAALNIRRLHIGTISPDNGLALVVADPNELLDHTGQTLLAKLRSVQDLCGTVISSISSNAV